MRLWDLTTGDEMGFLKGHSGTLFMYRSSSEPRVLSHVIVGVVKALQVESSVCVTGGVDGQIRIWDLDLAASAPPLVSPLDVAPTSLENVLLGQVGAANPFDSVGAGTVNGNAEEGMMREERSADKVDGPCVRTLDGHTKAVTSLYFDGSCLVRSCAYRRDHVLIRFLR